MTDQEIELLGRLYGMTGAQDVIGFAYALLIRAIPEGHVVVPKEPTLEMCAAGYYTHFTPCAPDVIYRAMIAAAPANKEGT